MTRTAIKIIFNNFSLHVNYGNTVSFLPQDKARFTLRLIYRRRVNSLNEGRIGSDHIAGGVGIRTAYVYYTCYRAYHIACHQDTALRRRTLCVYFNFQCFVGHFMALNFCAAFTRALKLRQRATRQGRQEPTQLDKEPSPKRRL